MIILALECLLLERSLRRTLAGVLPMFVCAIPVILVNRSAQLEAVGIEPALLERGLIAGDAISFYLGRLFYPIGATIHYGRTPWYVLEWKWRFFTGLLPYALAILLLVRWKHLRLLASTSAVFVASILPVLGFLPFMFQSKSTVADHYLYVAMLGPALLLAGLVYRYNRRDAVALSVAALCLLGAISFREVRHWRSSEILFERALQINPKSSLAHNNLGRVAEDAGREKGRPSTI